MGRGPHRYMYNQVMHHSSQLTRQTPAFQLLFQTYSRKKKQTLSVQFRQPKSGSNKSGRGEGKKNNSVVTICGNIVKNVHKEQPRLSEVWASSVPLPVKFHQSIQPYKLFVFVVFLIPIFFPFWSYLQSWRWGEERGWMGGAVWFVTNEFRSGRAGECSALKVRQPCTIFWRLLHTYKQELAASRGNGFSWLK